MPGMYKIPMVVARSSIPDLLRPGLLGGLMKSKHDEEEPEEGYAKGGRKRRRRSDQADGMAAPPRLDRKPRKPPPSMALPSLASAMGAPTASKPAGGVSPSVTEPPPAQPEPDQDMMLKRGGSAKKWIQASGVDKPGHKGRLHRALGVPEGEKIPASKIEEAARSHDSHLRHMANFAKNVR